MLDVSTGPPSGPAGLVPVSGATHVLSYQELPHSHFTLRDRKPSPILGTANGFVATTQIPILLCPHLWSLGRLSS